MRKDYSGIISFWEDTVSKGNETHGEGWKMCLSSGRANATLDLINRQNAEIERLQAVADAELDTIHKLGDDYERALEKEQEYKAEAEGLRKAILDYEETTGLKKAKAEAIKEFAERLKEKFKHSFFAETDLDNLVKEMVGDAE